MILFPRSRQGWLILIGVVLVAAAFGQLVSTRWGPFAFGLVATMVGSVAVVTAEAWRADIWHGTHPPDRIDPGQSVDYLVWRFRHRGATD